MDNSIKLFKGIKYKEEWKSIPNYENLYEISSFGRAKSLDRTIVEKNTNKNKFLKGRILKQGVNSNGYKCITLSLKGKLKTMQIHKLVAISFLNHEPNGMSLVIDHSNNDKTDNFYLNLKECTQRENTSRYKEDLGVNKGYKLGKYSSSISSNGIIYNLGSFDSKSEARKAYDDALFSIENNLPVKLKRRKQSSDYLGVQKVRENRYKSVIRFKGKQITLGLFDTEDEALNFYNENKIRIESGLDPNVIRQEPTNKHKYISFCNRRNVFRLIIKGKQIGAFKDESHAVEKRNEILSINK